MIIDAHAHLGYDNVFDEDFTEEELLLYYDKCGVDGAIVQPGVTRPYIEDAMEAHNRIHRLCKQYPGRFWGMFTINPHLRAEEYEKEAERCVKELGFVGVKINPLAQAVHPSKKDGLHVFEVARKLNIPVMVHTGSGTPFSDPVSIIPAAKAFKDVKIVLAHAGTDLLSQQALYVAREFENVYVEPSWLSILATSNMIKVLGPQKVMFSSDHAINVPIELAKYRTAIQDERVLEQVLSGTAIEVFNLNKGS